MSDRRVALYARVSTEQQARDHTIASQLAAVRERIAADGWELEPDDTYIDEGYSGSLLLRPALERLRDAVAAGEIERVYVLAPDRLARRYAHQVFLIEEFRRTGAELVFLNHPISGTAEDDLLLQIQGVIAEYERAKILERSRRGRRHAARSGLVSAFTTAPYGYRYIPKDLGGGTARFEVVPEEARIVRQIFTWVGLERLSLREVCRRLQQTESVPRRGAGRWYASTVRGMLQNMSYIGRAIYGHARYVPAPPRLRPIRGHPQPCRRPSARIVVPREEWIEVPVPALVDPVLFEAAQVQLSENRRRKRESYKGPRWLLQGLTVCRRCGYAYYGKTAPRSQCPGDVLHYYRCIGTDGHRFDGHAICDNPALRGDHLEQAVWERVRALMEQPDQVAAEYHRRLQTAKTGSDRSDEVAQLDRQIASLQGGIGRLIDSYAEGVIERAEFEPRIAGLKGRLAQLRERRQAALDAAEAERELTLIIGRLEEFAAKVRQGLDTLDWQGKRDLVRTMVRRIEIDGTHVEVVFRVPPPPAPQGPGQPDENSPGLETWQHCTSDHHPSAGKSDEAFDGVRAFDDLDFKARQDLGHGTAKDRPAIGAVGKQFLQEWKHSKQGRQQKDAAVTILNISSGDDTVQEQALRIDEDMPLLALDLFARIEPRRVDAGPPFSALLTLWLSITQPVGLASRSIFSRHFTYRT
jgi:site-specific DNA recombinase